MDDDAELHVALFNFESRTAHEMTLKKHELYRAVYIPSNVQGFLFCRSLDGLVKGLAPAQYLKRCQAISAVRDVTPENQKKHISVLAGDELYILKDPDSSSSMVKCLNSRSKAAGLCPVDCLNSTQFQAASNLPSTLKRREHAPSSMATGRVLSQSNLTAPASQPQRKSARASRRSSRNARVSSKIPMSALSTAMNKATLSPTSAELSTRRSRSSHRRSRRRSAANNVGGESSPSFSALASAVQTEPARRPTVAHVEMLDDASPRQDRPSVVQVEMLEGSSSMSSSSSPSGSPRLPPGTAPPSSTAGRRSRRSRPVSTQVGGSSRSRRQSRTLGVDVRPDRGAVAQLLPSRAELMRGDPTGPSSPNHLTTAAGGAHFSSGDDALFGTASVPPHCLLPLQRAQARCHSFLARLAARFPAICLVVSFLIAALCSAGIILAADESLCLATGSSWDRDAPISLDDGCFWLSVPPGSPATQDFERTSQLLGGSHLHLEIVLGDNQLPGNGSTAVGGWSRELLRAALNVQQKLAHFAVRNTSYADLCTRTGAYSSTDPTLACAIQSVFSVWHHDTRLLAQDPQPQTTLVQRLTWTQRRQSLVPYGSNAGKLRLMFPFRHASTQPEDEVHVRSFARLMADEARRDAHIVVSATVIAPLSPPSAPSTSDLATASSTIFPTTSPAASSSTSTVELLLTRAVALAIGAALALAYLGFAFSRTVCVHSRVWLAVSVVVVTAASTTMAMGLSAMLLDPLALTDFLLLLPVVALFASADHASALLAAYDSSPPAAAVTSGGTVGPPDTIDAAVTRRVGHAAANAGPPLVLASVAEAAVLVSAHFALADAVPAVASFAAVLAIATGCQCFLSIMVFSSVLSIDARRTRTGHTTELCCCAADQKRDQPPPPGSEDAACLCGGCGAAPVRSITTMTVSLVGRIFVLLCAGALVGLGAFGLSSMDEAVYMAPVLSTEAANPTSGVWAVIHNVNDETTSFYELREPLRQFLVREFEDRQLEASGWWIDFELSLLPLFSSSAAETLYRTTFASSDGVLANVDRAQWRADLAAWVAEHPAMAAAEALRIDAATGAVSSGQLLLDLTADGQLETSGGRLVRDAAGALAARQVDLRAAGLQDHVVVSRQPDDAFAELATLLPSRGAVITGAGLGIASLLLAICAGQLVPSILAVVSLAVHAMGVAAALRFVVLAASANGSVVCATLFTVLIAFRLLSRMSWAFSIAPGQRRMRATRALRKHGGGMARSLVVTVLVLLIFLYVAAPSSTVSDPFPLGGELMALVASALVVGGFVALCLFPVLSSLCGPNAEVFASQRSRSRLGSAGPGPSLSAETAAETTTSKFDTNRTSRSVPSIYAN